MSEYGRAWQVHRDQMKYTAKGYRELADAIEKGDDEEVARLDGVVKTRRSELAYTKQSTEKADD